MGDHQKVWETLKTRWSSSNGFPGFMLNAVLTYGL